MRVLPWNTLGPTENLFVSGASQTLDTLITFGTAELIISDGIYQGQLTSEGAITLNRQTGLFNQICELTNTGNVPSAFRVLVKNLEAGIKVWNAHGTIGTVPYFNINQVLAPGQKISFTIEYFSPNRVAPANPQLEVVPINPQTFNPAGLTQFLQPRTVAIGGDILVEFNTENSRMYFVQYSSDLQTWITAEPGVAGTGGRVQWIDNGPPKTTSKPSSAGQRFYQIRAQ